MKKNKILISILFGAILLVIASWNFIFKTDFIYIFKFWLTLFLVGTSFYPLTSLIFKKFHDKGWFFSKIIGITLTSWLMWLFSYAKILEYSTFNSYLILGLLIIVNIFIIIYKIIKRKNTGYKLIETSTIKNLLITELIFIICLSFWCYIKGLNPAITNSTEQFMDYGFMNSIMNSKYMPPEDIWHSGTPINYYYFGQYWSGFICKIANLQVNEGYNLINALIASCTFVMPYVIGFNLFKCKLKLKKKSLNKFLTYALALTIGFGICFGGTLHYPIYRFFSNDKESYSYVDETRFIGFKPDTKDKAVTEVPVYSSILGDLHAQYIALIFSFTIIALLLEYFLCNKKRNILNSIFNPCLILIAFLFGIQKMTNYWDFPIYMVIISAVIITKNLICNKFTKKQVLKTILNIAELILIEELVTLPFSADLYISGTNVFFTNTSSPLYKFAILWGLQIFCIILFFIMFFWNFKKSKIIFKKYLVKHLNDLFVLILGTCAIGLIFLPEIVYLKDIYGYEYQRFNTMFKLTYEAFILFGICVNYVIFKLFTKKSKAIIASGLLLLIINVSTFGYGIDAIYTNYINRKYLGISSSENYLKDSLKGDYDALQWIKKNIEPSKIILEASNVNSSYTTYSRISVFSGNPTVLGWVVHQWLWRMNSDYSMPAELSIRNNDIWNFYTSTNLDSAKDFIKKYNVSYIYIGSVEYKTYSNMDLDFLLGLGEIVYQSNDVNSNNTYIIEVKQ